MNPSRGSNHILEHSVWKQNVNTKEEAIRKKIPGCRCDLRPLLVCLKLVGLWCSSGETSTRAESDVCLEHFKKQNDNQHINNNINVYHEEEDRVYKKRTTGNKPDSSGSKSSYPRRVTFLKIYNLLTCFLLWANLGITASSFRNIKDFDGHACNMIVSVTWFLQVAFIASSNFHKHVTGSWDCLMDEFDSYFSAYGLQISSKGRRLCWLLVLGFIVWLGLAFTFGGLSSLFVLSSVGPFGRMNGFAIIISVKAFFVLIYFYFVSAWYLLTSLYCVICVMLVWAFSQVNQNVKRSFKNGGSCKAQLADVEGLRLQHDRACRLLQAADTTLSTLVLLTISCVIPLTVFTVYYILVYPIKANQLMAVWWSVSLALTQLALVFILGGGVNHFAHLPIQHLYSVDLRWLSPAKIHQISIFLQRLTAQSIGLTACGLFVIDKPTIITFAGTIITYTVVVIQFRTEAVTDSQLPAICNCTHV